MRFTTMRYDWATPIAHPLSPMSMNHVLRRGDGCLVRRQGGCPGKEFCPDCPWNQGCLADGSHPHRGR